jgi:opacity protein-like surface antigen
MWRKVVITGLTCLSLASASYALDPIGPPKALLGQGGWSLGVEYAYSEADVDASNVDASFPGVHVPTEPLTANRAYAKLRYGLRDQVDLFARAGAVTFDTTGGWSGMSGKAGFAWGLGAAATLYHTDRLDWGVLAQFSGGKSSAEGSLADTDAQVEMYSVQIAAGPTYQLKDDLAVYGGIFYYMLDGEAGTWFGTWDLSEDSPVGLFAGLDWAVKEDAFLNVEVQYGETAFAVATGLRWVIP